MRDLVESRGCLCHLIIAFSSARILAIATDKRRVSRETTRPSHTSDPLSNYLIIEPYASQYSLRTRTNFMSNVFQRLGVSREPP